MTVRAIHGGHVVLRPGELHFGGPGGFIETLLGSCVAITLWHPRYRIGGMSHYVVPQTGLSQDGMPPGHSAPGALKALCDHVAATGTRPEDYVIKIFGGGSQFVHARRDRFDVGRRNVEAGLSLLAARGLQPEIMHVRGSGHRRVILDLDTGHVWLRHGRVRPHADE